MKQFFTLLFIAVAFAGFAQEEENKPETEFKEFISVGGAMVDDANLYAMLEVFNSTTEKGNKSAYVRLWQSFSKKKFTTMIGEKEAKATGYGAALGSRSYFSKKHAGNGFFYANEIKYFKVKFDEYFYKGRYSYVSLFAPELGYKIGFGKNRNFNIEFFAGTEWAIEIKGKGDVDNKDFDNWKIKAGAGIGYKF